MYVPYLPEVMFLLALSMLVLIINDIIAKAQQSVNVIRYLGTSSQGANPLEAMEYEKVNNSMKTYFTNIKGG